MSISQDEFKASWQWLKKFQSHRGLEKMLLHGEGAEVDMNDPELLEQLDALNQIIAQYDVEGFNSLFKKLILLKEQILLANFGAIDAGGEYDGLVSDFDKLESRMRNLSRSERQKKARSLVQLTLHDCFRQ